MLREPGSTRLNFWGPPPLMDELMTTQTAPTVKDYLKKLAAQDTSAERDEIIVTNILHKIGFPAARIVYGIVYLEGEGQPTSIQHVAEILVDIVDKAGF